MEDPSQVLEQSMSAEPERVQDTTKTAQHLPLSGDCVPLVKEEIFSQDVEMNSAQHFSLSVDQAETFSQEGEMNSLPAQHFSLSGDQEEMKTPLIKAELFSHEDEPLPTDEGAIFSQEGEMNSSLPTDGDEAPLIKSELFSHEDEPLPIDEAEMKVPLIKEELICQKGDEPKFEFEEGLLMMPSCSSTNHQEDDPLSAQPGPASRFTIQEQRAMKRSGCCEDGRSSKKKKVPVIVRGRKMPQMDLIRHSPEDGQRYDAKFQTWVNEGEYRCGICALSFKVEYECKRHVRIQHKDWAQNYAAQFGSMAVKEVLHACKICGQNLVHQCEWMRGHFERQHRMTTMTYFLQFILRGSSKKNALDVASQVRAEMDAKMRLDHRWPDKFVVQCCVCDKWYRSFGSLNYHFKARHGQNVTQPTRLVEENVKMWADKYSSNSHSRTWPYGQSTAGVDHYCNICKRPVQHDSIHLNAHFKSRHHKNMTLHTYYAELVHCKKLESWGGLIECINCFKYKCHCCKIKFLSVSTLLEHVWDCHGFGADMYFQKSKELITTPITYKCRVCCEPEQEYTEAEFTIHLTREHNTNIFFYHADYLECTQEKKQDSSAEIASGAVGKTTKSMPWYTGCEYECQFEDCAYMFYSKQDLLDHLEMRHGGGTKSYLAKFKTYESKTVYTVCFECKKPIRREYEAIKDHLKVTHHGLSMISYRRRHNIQACEEVVQTVPSGCDRLVAVVTPPRKKPTETFELWVNKAKFMCQICTQYFDDGPETLEHVKKEHDMAGKKYNESYGAPKTAVPFHNCQLCSKRKKIRLSNIYNILIKHIEQGHGISLQQYYYLYVKGDINTCHHSQCNKCKQWFGQFEDIRTHLQTVHGFIQLEEDKIDETRDVKKWGYRCLYECKVCSFSCQRKSEIEGHLEEVHKNSGQCGTKSKTHFCILCNTALTHELDMIKNHAMYAHKMDVTSYHSQVMAQQVDQHIMEHINCNKYMCRICLTVHLSEALLKNHIIETHGDKMPSLEDYIEKYGVYKRSDVTFICLYCDDGVDRTPVEMGKHLYESHKETFPEYIDKLLLNSTVSTTGTTSA